MKLPKALIALFFLISSCQSSHQSTSFVVTNEWLHSRSTEVVSVPGEWFVLMDGQRLEDFAIADDNGVLQLVQYVDENQDGISDGILFQPKVPARGKAKYIVTQRASKDQNPESERICFSRFVPERTDDYAWENDKVAFRTFGPTAQKMKEAGIPGGTLTSGIDCWLKKVEYPIIDKWYEKYASDPNAYHVDTGEGLDNFHVGISRGCGGLAVYENGEYYTSKNFTTHHNLAYGYMRTSFELDYAPWSVGDSKMVKTTNRISLDRGQQLSRIEVQTEGVDQLAAGLTLHENDGEITVDSLGAWVSYYQPHGNSYLATALVASPDSFLSSERVASEEKDLSHVYMNLDIKEGKTVYYAGFYWQESGQFEDKMAWEAYLTQFAAQLSSPLIVTKE